MKCETLIGLSDEDMDINTMITTYSTDAASEILGKERRRKKARDVLDLYDERRFEEEVV